MVKGTLKSIVLLLAGSSLLSCGKDSPFLITETQVGPLSQSTKVSELESIFAQDSLVRDSLAPGFGGSKAKIEVYEKGGTHLLTLTPSADSIPGIEHIQIIDPRYHTKDDIGLKSDFGEIEKHYEIRKTSTTLGSIVIFPKGSNLYFTIDKKELPGNIRYGTARIEAVQIPSRAKIKYLMIAWEPQTE